MRRKRDEVRLASLASKDFEDKDERNNRVA